MNSPVPVFSGKIVRGELQVHDRNYRKYMDSLEGRRVEFIVRKVRKKRSLAAERYYRGVILPAMVQATGYIPIEMHWLLKEMFLAPFGITSNVQLDWRSDDNGLQMQFIEWCLMLGASLGVEIPPSTKVFV